MTHQDNEPFSFNDFTVIPGIEDLDPYGLGLSSRNYHYGGWGYWGYWGSWYHGSTTFGTNEDDVLVAPKSIRRDYLFGLDGDDYVLGIYNDRLFGQDGDDVLDVTRGGFNSAYGGAGDDLLLGGRYDSLYGGVGDDTLVVGKGVSYLTGGPGSDTFEIEELPDWPNHITDFNPRRDRIVIDLDGVNSSDLNLVQRHYWTHIRLGTDTIAIVWGSGLDEDDIIFTHHQDVTAPILDAELLNDTGKSAEDGVTSDGTVVGKVTDDGDIVSLTAQFSSNEIEIELQEDGTFSLNHQDLEQLYGSTLADGRRSFTLWAEDAAGNISEQTISFVLDTVGPVAALNLKNDTGADSTDTVTTDPGIIVNLTDSSQIVSITYGFGSTPVESFTELTAFVQADGSLSLNREQLEDINGGGFVDGNHSFTIFAEDEAGNLSENTISFLLDTVAPTASIVNSLNTTDTVIEVNYSSVVSQIATENYILIFGEEEIPLERVTEIDSTTHQLHLAAPLDAGEYQLTITGVTDIAGNLVEETAALEFTVIGAPVSISPRSGSEMVSLTREVIVNFGKKVDPTTVNENTFTVIAQGEAVPGRIVVSSTQKFATFFPDSPLPASTSVRVTLDGNQVMGLDGVALDADGDGTAGGILTADFSTLSITSIEGTELFGYVYDSFNRDENGENIPIFGATIRVDALPEAVAVTDENGYFRLVNLPAPVVAVHIDGTTATNAPEGFVYPTVGKLLHTVPGQEIQLNHHGEEFDIFLPPMAETDTQQLSPTEDVQVGLGAAGIKQLQQLFPEIDKSTWDLLQVTFPAGSAQDEAGNVAKRAIVIPVNPGRLPAPLPSHLNPKIVISVQAEGATNFDVPAPVTFPNLEGLAPGAKCLLFSFNHDSGSWEVVGTGTVRPDGLAIVSDPGTGVLAPGWHFVNEASPTDPLPPCDEHDGPEHNGPVLSDEGVRDYFFTRDTKSFTLKFTNDTVCPDSGDNTLVVKLTADGPVDQFLEGLPEEKLELDPGQSKTIKVEVLDMLADIPMHVADQLYAAQITVQAYQQGDPSNLLVDKKFNVARFLSVVDPEGPSNVALFVKTLADGSGGFVRKKELEYHLPTKITTTFSNLDGPFYSEELTNGVSGSGTATLTFDPWNEGNSEGRMGIKLGDRPLQIKPIYDGEFIYVSTDYIFLKGTIVAPTTIGVSKAAFETLLRDYLTEPGNFDGEGVGTIHEASDLFKKEFSGVLPNQNPTNQQLDEAISNAGERLVSFVRQHFEPVNERGNAIRVNDEGGQLKVNWGFNSSTIPFGETVGDFPGIGALTNDSLSKASREYIFAEELNIRPGSVKANRPIVYFNAIASKKSFFNGPISFTENAARIASHELGHELGLGEAYWYVKGKTIRTYPYDIQSAGIIQVEINRSFSQEHVLVLQAATGVAPNEVGIYHQPITTKPVRITIKSPFKTLSTLELYRRNHSLPYDIGHSVEIRSPETPLLNLSAYLDKSWNFEEVAGDGIGGDLVVESLGLKNLGLEPLVIESVTLANSNNNFLILNDLAGTILEQSDFDGPEGEVELKVLFDPLDVGDFTETLIIHTNDPESPHIIELQGRALEPRSEIAVKWKSNNNFGGIRLGEEPRSREDFVTITNNGILPLSITDIGMNEWGAGQFTVSGLPEDFGPDRPLLLDRGESLKLDVHFDANELGLQRGQLQIVSNDPDQPLITKSLVGTGLPDLDNNPFPDNVRPSSKNDPELKSYLITYPTHNYIVVETGNSNIPQRTRSNAEGHYRFILPASTPYKVTLFDPLTQLVGSTQGTTAPSGEQTRLRYNPRFGASESPDTDGDGLPDDIEFTIGTSDSNPDTDGDGIDDFQEIELGLDPLSGLVATTGIMASLPLKGEAKAVVVENQTAYVATGTFGLTIVDIGQFNNPIIQGQLDLPGDATDVAVDSDLQTVVVATNGGGLQLIDIPDPMLPSLRATLQIAANQVEIFDGIAYATEGNSLIAMDLLTGFRLPNTSLPGDGIVTGLAREGTNLYGYISGSDTFFIVDIADPTAIKVTGQLDLAIASSDVGVFAADGVAYLAGSGLRTIDISNPNNPSLIGDADLFFTARNVALNGSGLALVAAEDLGLSVYDVTDPSATDAFVAGFGTHGLAYDVAIAAGIAYVADGPGGLQIINYLPFDNQGQAPNTEITSPVEDLDPDTEGVQVIEGMDIPIISDITDDVQVRNVELLVNGEVVGNDVSFPFELTAVALNQEPEATAVEVQVRATDTGGNTALSNVLSFQLLPEEQGPTIQNILPRDGVVLNSGLEAVTISFDKPLATDTVNANTFKLLNGSGELVPARNIQLRSSDRLVQLTFEPLPQSDYQLVILGSSVTDRVGNALSESDVVSEFTLEPRVTFSSYTIPLDHNLRDFIRGDINGDEIVDLVVAGNSKTSILFGAGDGTFPADSFLDIDLEAQLLGLGNFNGDDHLDLFSINSNNSAGVFLNDGDGTFSNEEIPVLPEELEINNPSDVVIDDLNSDGVDDVVYGDYNEGVTVLLGLGNGLFTKTNQHQFSGLTDIGLADFNQDGNLDVVASNDSSQKLSVFLGSGDGTLATGTEFSVGGYSNSVDVGDVNGDGNLDLITGNTGYSSGSVSLLLGLGNGSFGAATNYFEDDSVPSAALGDLDGDNDLDLLWTTDPGSASVPTLSWRLNSGSGSFGETNQFLLGETELEQVELADLDGDGYPDLIALSGGSLFTFRNEI